jgi:hypothetical protein
LAEVYASAKDTSGEKARSELWMTLLEMSTRAEQNAWNDIFGIPKRVSRKKYFAITA